jgi:azurin
MNEPLPDFVTKDHRIYSDNDFCQFAYRLRYDSIVLSVFALGFAGTRAVFWRSTMLRKLLAVGLFSIFSMPVYAAQCDVTIESNDAMQFDIKEITVDKSCTDFTINLKHVGKLPKNAMGHNVVVTKESDMQAVATEGIAAGLDADYVKAGDDRVIAHTKMIGGGESTSVTFDVSKLAAGEAYGYFCSFPGHWAIMKGTLKLSS